KPAPERHAGPARAAGAGAAAVLRERSLSGLLTRLPGEPGADFGAVGRGDVVFLDKLDHASIVDGAKMSYGETVRFNHGDLAALERKLQQVPPGTGMMVIVDGVYSMEGDIADVPSLLKICQKYGAALALDDAHA